MIKTCSNQTYSLNVSSFKLCLYGKHSFLNRYLHCMHQVGLVRTGKEGSSWPWRWFWTRIRRRRLQTCRSASLRGTSPLYAGSWGDRATFSPCCSTSLGLNSTTSRVTKNGAPQIHWLPELSLLFRTLNGLKERKVFTLLQISSAFFILLKCFRSNKVLNLTSRNSFLLNQEEENLR